MKKLVSLVFVVLCSAILAGCITPSASGAKVDVGSKDVAGIFKPYFSPLGVKTQDYTAKTQKIVMVTYGISNSKQPIQLNVISGATELQSKMAMSSYQKEVTADRRAQGIVTVEQGDLTNEYGPGAYSLKRLPSGDSLRATVAISPSILAYIMWDKKGTKFTLSETAKFKNAVTGIAKNANAISSSLK